MTRLDKWRFWSGVVLLAAAILWLVTSAAPGQTCGPGGCPAPSAPSWQQPSITAPANIHPAVCRVKAGGAGGTFAGTGTLIDKDGHIGIVITNAHIVRGNPGKIACEFPNGRVMEATVARVEEPMDLALLVISDHEAEPVDVSEASPQPGETVTVQGYGSGQYRAVSGRVGRYASFGSPQSMSGGRQVGREMAPGGATNTFAIAVQTRPGDSGSPVFNGRGQLVGVLWGGGQGDSEAVPSALVHNFVLTSGRYLLPWNARINDPARDPRNQPPSPPAPVQPGAPVDLSPLAMKLDAILAAIQGMREQPMVPVVPPEEPKADVEGEVQKALEKTGLLERLKEKAVSVIGWPHILGGAGLGIGGFAIIAGVAVWLIRKDFAARRATGDPLALEKLLELNQRLLERIPGERLDTVNEKLSSLVERLADRVAPKPAPPA